MGRKARLGDCFRRGLRRVPALMGLALLAVLAHIALIVGFVLIDAMHLHPALIVLVIIVAVIALLCLAFRFVLSGTVVIVEQASPIMALKRSWKLMHCRWWRTLGLMLLGYLIVSAISYAVELIVALITGEAVGFAGSDSGSDLTGAKVGTLLIGYAVLFVLMLLVSVVLQPFMSNWMVAVYLDARLHDENLGPQLMESAGIAPAATGYQPGRTSYGDGSWNGQNGYGQPSR